jgi:putative DNA methylase
MLKRLIEVALPLKEVSEQSAREKPIRHGHISTLHLWWARKPLAACRAAVLASLIPDPDDAECPTSFRKEVIELLEHERFRPSGGADGKPVEDTARNRCLELLKQLGKWENSLNPEFIEPAQKLIAEAHKFLNQGAERVAPKVLDPFAGGGAIPLEALRLGCEAHAIDLNPVAHLIELCTLVYPQKYGQPNSRPAPEYIKRLVAHNRAKKKTKAGSTLFDNEDSEIAMVEDDEFIPNVEITEAAYVSQPLATDVKYWGNWIIGRTRRELSRFYETDSNGLATVAYIWARTVTCPNPECQFILPLLSQFWLCKKATRRIALQLMPDASTRRFSVRVVEGTSIDFNPNDGTMRRGNAECPSCRQVAPVSYIRKEFSAGAFQKRKSSATSPAVFPLHCTD